MANLRSILEESPNWKYDDGINAPVIKKNGKQAGLLPEELDLNNVQQMYDNGKRKYLPFSDEIRKMYYGQFFNENEIRHEKINDDGENYDGGKKRTRRGKSRSRKSRSRKSRKMKRTKRRRKN